MIIIKRGRWYEAHLLFFTYKRVYIRGHPVPLCRIKYRKEPTRYGKFIQADWSFLERVRFMVSCWLANWERRIKPNRVSCWLANWERRIKPNR